MSKADADLAAVQVAQIIFNDDPQVIPIGTPIGTPRASPLRLPWTGLLGPDFRGASDTAK